MGKTVTIKSQIEELEKKILEIGGSKLLAQKSKVDGIRLLIGIANDEMTKAEVAKAKAEKDVVKYEASIETNEANLEEANAEAESLKRKIQECVDYIGTIRDEVNKAQEAAENAKEDLDNLKAELDEKTEAIQAFREREVSVIVIGLFLMVPITIHLRWCSNKR